MMVWAPHKQAQLQAGLAGRAGAGCCQTVSSCSVPWGGRGEVFQGRSGERPHIPEIPGATAASSVGSLWGSGEEGSLKVKARRLLCLLVSPMCMCLRG